jgi:superoxide reductase
MTQRFEVYKCAKCGIVVEVLTAGAGALVCCDEPMRLLKENTTDAATEKHVPVIEKTADGLKVSVGSVPHPMTEEHLIEWIEVIADGKICRKYLSPGDEPVAVFCLQAENVVAREYCNLHGVWKAE